MGGEEEKRLKRKHSLQASVTLGLGYGNKKQRHIEAFYSSESLALFRPPTDAGWTLLQGEGYEEGVASFLPPGVSMCSNGEVHGDVPNTDPSSPPAWDCAACGNTNVKSQCAGSVDGVRCMTWRGGKRLRKPYFSKVRDVIERVLEKKSVAEAKAADAFVDEVPDAADIFIKKDRKGGKKDPSPSSSPQGTNTLTLWKDNWTHFEKASSRIGSAFQVDALPTAGSYISTTNGNQDGDPLYERVWNPDEAEKLDRLDFVHTRVKFNKRESSYSMLHSREYLIPGFYREVCGVSPTDCSDWTKADKDHFRAAMFEKHENMKEVSKMIGKPISQCITYYLVKFKRTKSFKSLKRSMKRKANTSEGGGGTWLCHECGKGGMLIACDTCEAHYHLACATPRLASIPDGAWHCSRCKRGTRSALSLHDDESSSTVPNLTEGSPVPSVGAGDDALKKLGDAAMQEVGDLDTGGGLVGTELYARRDRIGIRIIE